MDTKALRELLTESFEDLSTDILSPEEKDKIRKDIVDAANKVINIPIIGEAIEAAIIGFALRLIERIVTNFFKKKVIGGVG